MLQRELRATAPASIACDQPGPAFGGARRWMRSRCILHRVFSGLVCLAAAHALAAESSVENSMTGRCRLREFSLALASGAK
jgi:hypothetical protein